MADGETVVGRNISGAEARAAEGRLDDGAGLEKFGGCTDFRKFKAYGNAGGINIQRKIPVAAVLACKNRSSLVDVVKQTAGAAGDDALVCIDLAVFNLASEVIFVAFEFGGCLFLNLRENLVRIGHELVDRVSVRGMERKSDHALRLIEVDGDEAVVICACAGSEFLVALRTLVSDVVTLRDLVGLPDGGEARGLGGHNVDTVAEVDGQVRKAGADELENAVLYKTVAEGFLYKSKCDVVRTDTALRLAGDIYQNHLGHVEIPGVLKKLFYKLGAAFADAHGAESTVAGVRVGAENHIAAGGKFLAGIGVDDGLVRRHIDAAEALGCGQTEDMVILIDGAAHSAEAVVAVGHGIGQRELRESACACRLDDSYVGDVVGNHRVKTYLKPRIVAGGVMGCENAVGDGSLAGLVRRNRSGFLRNAVYQVDTALVEGYTSVVAHRIISFVSCRCTYEIIVPKAPFHVNTFSGREGQKRLPRKMHKIRFFSCIFRC